MDIYELQVESLLLDAPEQDIEEIQRLLQGRFSKLEPTLQLQRVTTVIPTHVYMRLNDYWGQQYGHDLEPVGYQLKQINFVFLADREQDQEALGMHIYAIGSEAARPFGKIEYFSSFGDPDGEELADKDWIFRTDAGAESEHGGLPPAPSNRFGVQCGSRGPCPYLLFTCAFASAVAAALVRPYPYMYPTMV